MKLFAGLVCLCLLAAGCDKFSQKAVEHHTQEAGKHAGKALGIATQSVIAKVQAMSADAPPEVQQALRDVTKKTQEGLSKMPKSEDVQKQIDQLKIAIEKLDAQKTFQDAQKGIQDAIDKAKKAGDSAAETQRRLHEADDAFRNLEEQADAARKRFEAADGKLKSM